MNLIRLPALASAMGLMLSVPAGATSAVDKSADTSRTISSPSPLVQPSAETLAMNSAPEPMKLSAKPERASEPAEPSQLLLMLATFAGLFVFLAHRRGGQE